MTTAQVMEGAKGTEIAISRTPIFPARVALMIGKKVRTIVMLSDLEQERGMKLVWRDINDASQSKELGRQSIDLQIQK